MSRQVIQVSIVILALIGTDASALGLGGLRTESALNQPFVGEIDLFDVKSDELDTIKATLAGPDAFAKSGIERYHFLTGLVFKPEVSARGGEVIRVTSREPIREPFMDFLVEVVWPAGQMVKEFTVLLDPPSMSERRAPPVQPPAIADRRAAAPPPRSRSAAGSAPPAQRTESADPAPSQPARRIPSGPDGFPAYFGPVPSGAGLLRLARGGQPADATTAQTALALYRNNQDAFINGDIDRLIAGKTLVIPTRAELFALDAAAAATELQAALSGDAVRRSPITEVARIDDAAASQSARLRIAGAAAGALPGTPDVPTVPAADDAATDSGALPSPNADLEQDLLLVIEASESARQETEELRERVHELETQLADIQTLLQLRNAELARLQGDASGESIGIEIDSEGSEQAPDPVLVEAEIAADGAEEMTSEPASETVAEEVVAAPDEPSAGDDAQVEPSVAGGETDTVAGSGDASPAAADVEEIVVAEEIDPADTTAWHSYLVPLAGFAGVTAIGVLVLSLLSARRRREHGEDEDEWSIDSAVLDFPENEPPPESAASEPDAPQPAAAERRPADAVAGSATDAGPTPPSKPGLSAPEPTAREPQIDSGLLTPSSQLTSFGHFETETDEADALSEADIYIAYGRYKEAEDLLKRELKRSPDRLDVRFKLAEVYAGAENPDALRKLMQHLKAAGADTADPARWKRLSAIAAVVEQGGTWDPGATMPITEATGIPAPETGPDLAALEGDADAFSGEAREDENDFFRLDLGELEPEPRPVTAAPSPQAETPSASTEDGDLPLLFDDSALNGSPDLPELSDLQELSVPSGVEELDRPGGISRESDLVLTLDDLRDSRDLDLDAFLDAGSPSAATSKAQPEERLPSLTLPTNETAPAPEKAPRGGPSQDVPEPPDDALSDQWAMDSGIWDENATKLDLARAYIEMDDAASAREILEEVIADGREEQRSEAQDMLRTLV
ncbi:FimV/HubP family polar landmark protein [Thiocapsa marina]|uniref:Motility protein FimV n=1 Tax=Thiocapsa marina 5811 TaxID=768671 RepID=F9UFG7_9GAMM|nr:FimV/HubP family polar landmark protein [Thiocapsa marina]EGV17204.1 Motility protein FimV [Thiocapsa marina 5811]